MSGDPSESAEDQPKREAKEPEGERGHNHQPNEYEQFVDFFENAAVPMHWVGPDGTVLHANQAELDALGYSREEYIGHHIAEFHADLEVIDDILDRLGSDEELQDYEARMERRDGSIRHVLIDSGVNWEDGEFVNTRCVTRDITARKKRERELQDTKSQLATAVTEKERQNQAFHTFLDIVTDSTRTFDQKMHDVLSLGADFLDLDIGVISNIDPPDYTVEHVVTPDGSIEQGDVLDFSDTYCTLVYESDGPVACRSPAAGDVEDHPCYQDMGLQGYLGEPLLVDGQRYGTLNFSSPSPREESFTEGERAFIRTVSEWVTSELGRHEREQEIERYAAMAETVQDGICILNRDSEFVEVNDAFIELTGYNRGELLGSHASLVRQEELNERFDQLQASLEADSDVESIEMEVHRADGNTRVVNVRYGRFAHEEGVGRVGVWRDITERLERERRLQRERDRLDEFASVISHDLRNPLRVAEGNLQLAKEDEDGEALDGVAGSLDRMDTLIEDMLSLASAGATVGATESVELGTLAEACWSNVETASAAFDIEAGRTIQADKSRLQQLLENLLRNAVEHGGEGVTITVGDLPNGFYVEDNGPGIPAKERDHVLEPGYSTREDGSGFGLNIVREIAEAHGWEITMTEDSDGGARFEFTGDRTE